MRKIYTLPRTLGRVEQGKQVGACIVQDSEGPIMNSSSEVSYYKFNFQNLIFQYVKMLPHSSLKVYESHNTFRLVNTSFLVLSLKCDLMYSAFITILNIYLSWH